MNRVFEDKKLCVGNDAANRMEMYVYLSPGQGRRKFPIQNTRVIDWTAAT